MPAIKLSVTEFVEQSLHHPVLDVRSEGEYTHAHIPAAFSLPLFNNEERAAVGTAYKQVSREQAIKIGLDYFGPKMSMMVEQAEALAGRDRTLLVHCWRGGMRSGAVAWLLDLYGFQVRLLEGGYKAFRNWTLQQLAADHPLQLIGGYTGSGKTAVLKILREKGEAVIDLEAIANHRGSAFGGLDRQGQPSSEMFENTLAVELFKLGKSGRNIWIEDESQRIGDINMPIGFWNMMRTRPLYFLDVPFARRLDHLVAAYGHFKKEALINAIVRIRKRLGGLETRTAITCLIEDDLRGCFEVLLKYYDKYYEKALKNRPELERVMIRLSCEDTDAIKNTEKILEVYHGERTE